MRPPSSPDDINHLIYLIGGEETSLAEKWVQALRDRTICDLVKVGTDDNLSDIFTKILGPNKFESLRDRMMVACNMPTPEELKAASAVPPTASVRRSTRRKRRPGHQTGS